MATSHAHNVERALRRARRRSTITARARAHQHGTRQQLAQIGA